MRVAAAAGFSPSIPFLIPNLHYPLHSEMRSGTPLGQIRD